MSLEPQHILCKKYYKSRPLTSVAKVFICCIFKKNNHQTSHLSLPASNIRYACEYIFSNYIKLHSYAVNKWRHIFIILFGNSFWRNMRLRNITSYIGTWAEHNIWPWKYAFKIYSQLWRKFFRVMVSCLNSDYYIDWYVCVTWFGYKLNRRQGKGNVRFVSIFPIKLPLNDKLYDDDRILPSRIKMIL